MPLNPKCLRRPAAGPGLTTGRTCGSLRAAVGAPPRVPAGALAGWLHLNHGGAMRKLVIWSVAVLAVVASAAVASAAGAGKESKFSIYLSHGSGDYEQGKVGPTDDYLPGIGTISELGGGAEYGMAMADDYQLAI